MGLPVDDLIGSRLAGARGQAPRVTAPEAPMPPESPLAMPVQSLTRFERSEARAPDDPRRMKAPILTRVLVFGGALALTAYGAHEMYRVVEVGGVTPLEWALVALFVLNFSWIALAFTSAVVGFFALLFRRDEAPAPPKTLSRKTAIVMPIYNEAPSRIFAALQAMREEVEATGLGGGFDYFFLSDTTDPDVWIAEERAVAALRARIGPDHRVYYRHRPKNTSRKAGNIGDFVSRWGGAYDHMLVLDADSVMTAHAIVTLAGAMEADPDSGIIQTLPLIVNRNTLFARVQQFAARIYGPVIAAGLSAWMGRDGNYWGHNAIIRVRAFAEAAGLPDLRGSPPFGGHILSHDFVEAALIRRAGWSVYMLPTLGGSYEESPPSLIDLSARDRRWCQGNLQHLRVLPMKRMHWASRQHFLTGIFSYLASPLWMAQLLIGIALVLQSRYIRPEYFSAESALFPAWPRFDAERSLALFGTTMAILLAPKLLGLALALLNGATRRGAGGATRLVFSALFETLMSALLAPIMMLVQSGSVLQIVAGRDSGWNPQRRDDGSIPLREIVRRHRSHVALGVLSLIAGLLISPSLVAWMSPTIAGLILAILISWGTAQLAAGLVLRRIGVLATPEETSPPAIMLRANALAEEFAARGEDGGDALQLIHQDAALRARHEAFLPRDVARRRGDIPVERAMAEAKLGEARALEEARRWLTPKERMALLHDRGLIERLARLPARVSGE